MTLGILLTAIMAGWVVSACMEWLAWRRGIVNILSWFSGWLGQSFAVDHFHLSLGGVITHIDADCTYWEWMVIALPLLWVPGPWKSNVIRIFVAAVLCQIINILRIAAALIATANGVDWFWSHDVPDYTLWYGSVAIIMAWSFRHWKRELSV